MSAQSNAKAAQGYVAKPVSSTCGNCASFATTRELPKWERDRNAADLRDGRKPRFTIESHGRDANLRCTIGSFAVKKMSTCNEFRMKVVP